MDLVRDVLDKQLIDRDGEKMGRVDGIALEIRDGAPPRVEVLELGFVVLAGRIHPRVETWFEKIRSRWSVRKTARFCIPWAQVEEVRPEEVQVALRVLDTPVWDWELWLRDKVIRRLPGGGS